MPKYELIDGNLMVDGVNGGPIEQIVTEHQAANALRVKEADDIRAADKAALDAALASQLASLSATNAKALADLDAAHVAKRNAIYAQLSAIVGSEDAAAVAKAKELADLKARTADDAARIAALEGK